MKCNGTNCNCHIFHQETLDKVNDNLRSDNKLKAISDYFKIISDFTRIKMLEAIKDDFLCVCDLGHLLGITKSAVSHQIKLFKEYDLVEQRREGKMVYYKLKDQFIAEMINNVGVELN